MSKSAFLGIPVFTVTLNVRDVIGLALVFMFCSCVPLLFWKGIPETSAQLINYMLGQLSGMASMVVAYHYVTKAGEKELDLKRVENTGKLADAVTAAQNSVPGVDGAGKAADMVADAAVDEADKIKAKKP